MRFLSTVELKQNSALKHLMVGVILFCMLFFILDLLLYHLQIGLTFEEALTTVLGNEDEFIEPIPFETLLLYIHTNLFFAMLTLLLLSAISTRVMRNSHPSTVLLHALFATAMLAPMSLLFGYFLHPLGVMAWVVLFASWHLIALLLSIKCIYTIVKL